MRVESVSCCFELSGNSSSAAHDFLQTGLKFEYLLKDKENVREKFHFA